VDVLNADPALPNTPLGSPQGLVAEDKKWPINFDNSLAKKLVDRDFITLKQSVRETAEQFVERGFW